MLEQDLTSMLAQSGYRAPSHAMPCYAMLERAMSTVPCRALRCNANKNAHETPYNALRCTEQIFQKPAGSNAAVSPSSSLRTQSHQSRTQSHQSHTSNKPTPLSNPRSSPHKQHQKSQYPKEPSQSTTILPRHRHIHTKKPTDQVQRHQNRRYERYL